MPLPDRIVCSGKFFLDIYLKHGAPRERLVLGPALRFNNLISKCEKDKGNSSLKVFKKNRILIVFPLAEPDALELAIKSSEAVKLLADIGKLKIGLKPHPMISVNKLNIIESFFTDIQCDMEIVDNPMDEVLPHYSILITMASGVVFDGMIEGLPVIRVGSSHSLNFDPADYLENNPYGFKAQTVEQLNTLISKLLLLEYEERIGVLNYGREFVKESFTLVNENTLKSFISIN
jgi:surface carbohydrate biosynthesis protein (TIGR04326 family)